MLKDLTELLKKQVDVTVLSYDLKINYICDECLKKEQDSKDNQTPCTL